MTCSGVVLCSPPHQHGQSAPAVNGGSTQHYANHCKSYYHAHTLLHMQRHRHTCPHLSMPNQSTSLTVLLIGGAICVPCIKLYPQQQHETKCTPKGIIKRNVPPNSIMKQYAQVRLCTCRVNNGSAQIPTAWKTSTCICTGASMQC